MTETISALMLTGDMTAGGTDVAAGAEVAGGADCCWTEAGVPHPTAVSHAPVITTRAMLNDSRVMVCPFSRAFLRGSEKAQEHRDIVACGRRPFCAIEHIGIAAVGGSSS